MPSILLDDEPIRDLGLVTRAIVMNARDSRFANPRDSRFANPLAAQPTVDEAWC